MENSISLAPQNLWQSKLACLRLRSGGLGPLPLTKIQAHCYKFCCKQLPMLFLLALKLNLQEKLVFCVMSKTNSNFAAKVAERSNRSFSVYLMNHLFLTRLIFNSMPIKCIEFHWLCKHRKKITSSQVSISINSCAELKKKTVFPVINIKLEINELTIKLLIN